MSLRLVLGAIAAAALIALLEARKLMPLPAALALYVVTALVMLAIWHRHVTAHSRIAMGVLLALPLLFTGHALLTDRALGPYDLIWIAPPFQDYAAEAGAPAAPHNRTILDLFLQMAPWQHQVRQSLAHGQWPLWNPSMLSGQVLAANAQTAPYDPLNLIALLLPQDIATTYGVAMTFFLAALFAFACAREFECSENAALIAATAFMCSSAIAFNGGWPVGRAWTVLPFVLLAVRRVVRDHDTRSFVLLTAALSLLIVTGHPETTLHVVSTGVVFGIYELWRAGREAWKGAVAAVAAGITALLLTAIFLLPFVTLLDESWEYGLRSRSTVEREWAAPPDELARAIRASFLPYSGGASWRTTTADWEFGTARVGSIVLALALCTAILFPRRRDVAFLAILGLFALLASWKFPPVGKALHALPLFDVGVNWRLGVVAALCFSLLAAMAFDARRELRHARWIAVVVAIVLGIATAHYWEPQARAGVDPKLLVAGATAEGAGIVLLIVALSLRSPRAAFVVLILALGAQRLVEDGNIYPAVPRSWFYPSVPIVDAVPRDPLYRTIGLDNYVVPNIGAFYGLDDIRGYEAMTLEAYSRTWPLWCPDARRTYHEVTDLSRPFLNFLAVRHALAPRTTEPPAGWRVVREDRNARLLENTRALPRVFVPRHIRYVSDHDAAVEEMKAASDFGDVAWVFTHEVPPHTAANGDATLDVRRVGSEYTMRVRSDSGTRVIVSESAWPGWRAYVDGRRVRIQLANRSFLSMHVPPGAHDVRLVYLPQAFVQGRAISIATLCALALWWSGRLLARRRRSRRVAPESAG